MLLLLLFFVTLIIIIFIMYEKNCLYTYVKILKQQQKAEVKICEEKL